MKKEGVGNAPESFEFDRRNGRPQCMGRAEVVNCKVDATYHFVDTRVTKKITPPSEFKICATFGDDERDAKWLAATVV